MDHIATIPLSNPVTWMLQRNFAWTLGPRKMGMGLKNCTLFDGRHFFQNHVSLCLSVQEAQNLSERPIFRKHAGT